METDTATVAKRVREDIDRISTTAAVARESGIAYNTLSRRLITGDFKSSELIAIARVLRSDPADYLRPASEHSRSAA